ncbi:glutathione peroxidase [Pseudoneobacillus rhizosphaerae]|uniref:Glutathione peroxidase n=1 Tax=Pseudoneobacillus rhizosphaerae TaxID=2880968 RepID=A0A9C7GD64_9BACI|nr:glutathione peroxidase [Pseudoneobacillus rhizosphaerae]CAG9610364.1 Hydroperoxy fatty acid reductase gpx1 [Pseudoneobacillus rhizosphaerae]
MSVYPFKVTTIKGEEVSLENYKGKVLLAVNTASECGLTPQYAELQKIYDQYKENGFFVLGFPCNQFGGQEPGSEEKISEFCSLNYGVSFPLFAKVDVNGENAHPLFQYLKEESPRQSESSDIEWNFAKFLINRNGQVVGRYAPSVSPIDIGDDIEKLLG